MRLACVRPGCYTGRVQVSPEDADRRSDRFAGTHWSVVVAAGRGAEAPEAAYAALSDLCRTYWPPLYGFVRGQGYSPEDAADRTQGFFAHLIERQIYTRADRAHGKFRSFLLASLKNYLADAYDRESALKRGGGCEFLPLHEDALESAETMFQSRAAGGTARPAEDRIFEQEWAVTLLRAALDRVGAEFAAEGKGALFAALQIYVRGGAEPLPEYATLAAALDMPVVTVRSHVSRLRARYREALRAELRRTVGSDGEVDAELRELRRILTER